MARASVKRITMSAASSDTFRFDSMDGASIAVHRWLPDSAPKVVMQIAHGMSEHGARYSGLASACNERGWAAYASDHRGHGLNVADGEKPGHVADEDCFGTTVSDVHQLASLLAARHPETPRILLGHSMGSFVVQRLLADHPEDADAFVLSASNGKPPAIATLGRGVARLERIRLGKRGASKLIDALSFKDFNAKFRPNRTEFDWLSRDEAQVDAYVADPLCGFLCSIQTWVDLLDALPGLTEREHVRRIPRDKPIYLFAGTRDAVGAMGRGVVRLRDTYKDAGLSRVEMKLYEGGRHEMLHETNRDQVMADLLAWCERALDMTAS